MKVVIDPRWTFRQAVDAAFYAYSGIGKNSKGYRNSVLLAWANMVGRERAVSEFNTFVRELGSVAAVARNLWIAESSVRRLEASFKALPRAYSLAPTPLEVTMELGKRLALEETRTVEFKEVRGSNPIDSIRNTVDEYAVAFLNSEGGRILWGVSDQAAVVGVMIDEVQRDVLRRAIAGKLGEIEPRIDPTSALVHLHPVLGENALVKGMCVVEVCVPRVHSHLLYFTGGGEAYVRLDGVKRKLRGPEIQERILRRATVSASSANEQLCVPGTQGAAS